MSKTEEFVSVKVDKSSDSSHNHQIITDDLDDGVKRSLQTRHLSMMALAGIIGPGLLVGTGNALKNGGPAALIIGFGVIGILAFCVMQSVGEITTLYPTKGAFNTLADRFVDKSLGFAVGWNYFIIWMTVLANEYNVLPNLLNFWTDDVPSWGFFLIMWFVFLGFQFLGVRAFGESEFWLALIKLIGLTAYFIFSIVYMAGGVKGADAIGFKYWNNPGAFSDGIKGVASVFVYCSTFYAGVEAIAIAATETSNPKKAVPIAVKQVFWRIIFIYMGAAIFYGATCPWNDPLLSSSNGRALKSPITVAITNAGWAGGKHLVNAFILITCLSAVNSCIYIGSRTVLFLAKDGKAPKFLGWTDKRGVPIPAIVFFNLWGVISLMNLKTGAADAFGYIINLSGVSTFLVWGSISFIHIKFRRAWIAQGHSIDELPYKAAYYPYTAWIGLIFNSFLALVQGWAVFKPFDAKTFVDAYILLPFFFILFFGFKFWFKTKWLGPLEVDLDTDRRIYVDDNVIEEKLPLWKRMKNSL